MKYHHLCVRRTLRWNHSSDYPGRSPQPIVGHRGGQGNQLQRGNANLLSHGDRPDADLRPAAYWLGNPTRLTRQLNSGLGTESEAADVVIHSVVTQPQSQFDCSHVARALENLAHG